MRETKYLFLGIAALCLGLLFNFLGRKSNDLSVYQQKIEQQLHQSEAEVTDILQNPEKIQTLLNPKEPDHKAELNRLAEKSYGIFAFRETNRDSLVFWSHYHLIPFDTEVSRFSNKKSELVTHNKKGSYILMKEPFVSKEKERYTILGLIPVKRHFSIQNEYIFDRFLLGNRVPSDLVLSAKETSYSIKDQQGEHLFYLDSANSIADPLLKGIALILFIIGFGILAWHLHFKALDIAKNDAPHKGFLFLLSIIVGVRLLTLMMGGSAQFDHLTVFKTAGSMPSFWNPTFGDLLINVVLFFWGSLFFHHQFRVKHLDKLSENTRFWLAGILYGLNILTVFGIAGVFRVLILRSGIPSDFNLFSLDFNNVLGLLGINILLLSFFFLTHRLCNILKKLNLSQTEKLTYLGVAGGLFLASYLFFPFDSTNFLLFIFACAYILLFDIFLSRGTATPAWLAIWLVVFAGFASGLIFQYNLDNDFERELAFAESLAIESDTTAERRLHNLERQLLNDNFIKNFATSPFVSRKTIISQVDKYFQRDNYLFNKFDYKVHLYSPDSLPAHGELTRFSTLAQKLNVSEKRGSENLSFWSNGKGDYEYLSNLAIFDDGKEIRKIIIEYLPKELDDTRVYPELLVDNSVKTLEEFSKYDYGVYKNGILVKQKGKSFYPLADYPHRPGKKYWTFQKDGFRHLLYKANAEKTIILSNEETDLIKPLSLFSYIFAVLLLGLILLGFLNAFVRVVPTSVNFPSRTTLRNRIHFSVIAVIFISFIVIGLVTVVYFQDSTQDYHKARLERKARSVLKAAEFQIEEQKRRNLTPYPDINSLSKIHKMDINLFDSSGQLLESSQPEIFDKALLSGRMNPLPFHELRIEEESKTFHEENIGGLKYRTAYLTLKTTDDDIIAYLGLPYYSQQSKLRRDITDFMGTLLNVYFLLLIVAGAMAVAVANSITRPISVIGEKLKQVKLGEKNEPLEWDNDDELGELIDEYNKMIGELEMSADLLAQSERETAWREMAKQVAHEIKNPLTPMKLSIQHLQRAYKANPEEAEPLMKRVTTTLIEQIDNLTTIASEFSNFAKMPLASNEKLEINHLITSVFDLFNEQHTMDISLEMEQELLFVFADKNQLLRVFNNLIKNAIQAIPDDREGQLAIRLQRKGDHAMVSVEDNGTGIPADKINRVFVPNFTTKNSGMGLGLAMSKNIVESFSGKIYFETEEGIGTTFFVKLPLFNAENEEDIIRKMEEDTKKYMSQFGGFSRK